MKIIETLGATSRIWQIFIADSTSTTGGGLSTLTFNSAGLTAYFHRDTDTTATAITLVTMTIGTYTSSGFAPIDTTNMPGWYQFCPTTAMLAAGAKSVAVHLKGATSMAPLPIEVQLSGFDLTTASSAQSGDSFARLGAPAGASLAADVATKMATYTQPTGFLAATFPATVASTTNITGGTITTVTNLTNAPTVGDLTAAMKASVTAAVPTAAATATAVLSAASAAPIASEVKKMNGATVNGTGVAGDLWRGA